MAEFAKLAGRYPEGGAATQRDAKKSTGVTTPLKGHGCKAAGALNECATAPE